MAAKKRTMHKGFFLAASFEEMPFAHRMGKGGAAGCGHEH
jgi:hypothetical protein